MSVTVELVLESLDRLVEMDDWLKAQAKSPVWIVMGQVPRRVTVGAYNVVGQPNIMDEPRKISSGTRLRFIFEADKEATLFKLTWG